MKTTKPRIQASTALRTEMASRFGCSIRTVNYALAYEHTTELAENIRKYAIEHGAAPAGDDFIPNCLTRHTVEEMIQEFANGVMVIVNKKSGDCTLKSGSHVVESFKNMSVRDWSYMVAKAQQLSEILTVRAMQS